jgi:hypothetical protein
LRDEPREFCASTRVSTSAGMNRLSLVFAFLTFSTTACMNWIPSGRPIPVPVAATTAPPQAPGALAEEEEEDGSTQTATASAGPGMTVSASTRVRSSESVQESHKMNGREIGRGGGGGEGGTLYRGRRIASASEMKKLLAELDDVRKGERHKAVRDLIDPYYLTMAQVRAIAEMIPRMNVLRALSDIGCSVVDPENARTIIDVVGPTFVDDAVQRLDQRCFAKHPHDSRPAGVQAEPAKPPPGAYKLPYE